MTRRNLFLAVLMCGLMVMICGAGIAQDQAANVAGSWTLSATTQRGTFTQAMTIQQDGSSIKGTIKGRRGETPFTGTVKGNAINFTVSRDTPRGTFTMTYDGTVDGDSMKGTAKNDRFSLDWTAKRGGDASGGQQ
ncbi:MAG TPA: hypothetical protein VGY31_00175 [Terriglobia bacterium]|nr:hypothetical protein [Terriglobia bacterium]